jgi:hypothetical protein
MAEMAEPAHMPSVRANRLPRRAGVTTTGSGLPALRFARPTPISVAIENPIQPSVDERAKPRHALEVVAG